MTTVNVEHEYFTCQQVEDLALLKINKGAKKLLTSVDSKETVTCPLSLFQSVYRNTLAFPNSESDYQTLFGWVHKNQNSPSGLAKVNLNGSASR
jgi:hypothetical protein